MMSELSAMASKIMNINMFSKIYMKGGEFQ